ncbi:MAG: metal-sensitive transcriptional regulator [Patescibacteria group bacterium]|nr:metal-sensitive transcriptional regulator [Patescibacteria group bacterium]
MNQVNARLKKIAGQINGIMKMIDEGEDCEKIIIQFQASKAAIDSAYAEILSENLQICLKSKNSAQMNKIVKLITKK